MTQDQYRKLRESHFEYSTNIKLERMTQPICIHCGKTEGEHHGIALCCYDLKAYYRFTSPVISTDHTTIIAPEKETAVEECKHTSGPWTIQRGSVPLGDTGDYDPFLRIMDQNKEVICDFPINVFIREDEENEANAELIAKAPEMLEELTKLREDKQELVEGLNKVLEIMKSVQLSSNITEILDTYNAAETQLQQLIEKHGK